jgi:hypothetical protein
MKMVLFRKPFDTMSKKTLNFLPYFGSNNYIIKGTQIIPSDVNVSNHLILENFKDEDFQFKGLEFNSGFKIYYEDGNHLKQKYLLFESHAIIKNMIPKKHKHLHKSHELIFDSSELNMLL